MKDRKEEIISWILVGVILFVLLALLGVINENSIKKCVEAGETEQYCREGLR